MSKKIIIPIILVLAVGLFVVGAQIFTGEDVWLCQNGQWVKHGNPSSAMPTTGCSSSTSQQNQNIQVYNVKSGDSIESPFIVEGKAKAWYFEATFPVKLVDEQGKVLLETYAQAQGDWMTAEFAPFKSALEFEVEADTKANLILMKDNPSGLSENDEQISIPVTLKKSSETESKMIINVFYNNNKMDPEVSCNKVFPVARVLVKTQALARSALESLLVGNLTQADQEAGFSTSISQGVVIQKLTIENNVAKVDFNDKLEYQMGGSCRVSAIRAQITETLKQFSTVKDVIISINGRTEDILQP